MAAKRCRWVDYESDSDGNDDRPSSSAEAAPERKRRRVDAPQPSSSTAAVAPPPGRTGRDLLSPLPNELLVRILSFLPLQHLLAVAPVSRRFYHLSGDSQIWKALYYARFVLPRAMRIPGFRDGVAGSGTGHKLHYSGRRTLWADGRWGGLVEEAKGTKTPSQLGRATTEEARESKSDHASPEAQQSRPGVNWKRQYKIRYNWSRGKCAVEELRMGNDLETDSQQERKMLAKVVDGIAITADETFGLRAWDLKTRQILAQISTNHEGRAVAPSSIAIDDKGVVNHVIDVVIGFVDGSFGVWRLFIDREQLELRYRHEKSTNGELIAMAFSHPYLLTATESVLISLYTFDQPSTTEKHHAAQLGDDCETEGREQCEDDADGETPTSRDASGPLAAPYLLTSLKSHTSHPPLALSIRKTSAITIASIAYTFSTRQGWSIGIQDLHIRPSTGGIKTAPEIIAARISYTVPMDFSGIARLPHTAPARSRRQNRGHRLGTSRIDESSASASSAFSELGPTSLCYTHPYLLATLPDNTLVLHMCTSNSSSLSISRGIRLWGHTSGISDAEITSRGKAVSVSSRGEEMRVWELEGQSTGINSRSVEIRPDQSPNKTNSFSPDSESIGYDWEERRNWVGFDDEMVIVLKEKKGGSESLMVYDFT
ncbi:hypothetical protein B0H66DRAFT_94417 [Apodospora peruviana]|uniref:F-box domain-containing protein n=1 Tax=Apodospora peruviana TaxID=516989 RepID=A0AAE0IU36_9PEZI|nr:hypothetical protein B0H66DRAFT_94417 [Apodospora peruviana]